MLIDEPQTDSLHENELIAQRWQKLAELRTHGNAYPNDFRRTHVAAPLHTEYGDKPAEFFEQNPIPVKLAGRIMTRRLMGKASFVHIQDMSGQMQVYVKEQALTEGLYESFKKWDIGDIIGVTGTLFKTKTQELSIHATQLQLLSKSLRPLPDKFHGLADTEQRYRQRYLDLICHEEVKKTFVLRSRIIQAIRSFMQAQGFMEVETPMMQTLAGGAVAKPFITHHNTLNMDLFLRIAPELYLKRLVVGGFEKVFEMNRNFRNEGVSARHNPEFTMIEWYQAYADYHDAMDMTELLIRTVTQHALGTLQFNYQQHSYDFSQPFQRMTLIESIIHYNPHFTVQELTQLESLRTIAQQLRINYKATDGAGKLQAELFDKLVEPQLLQPTFITQYPAEISPLARKNDKDPFFTDRFELFIGGRELANGFSELNDPEDQAERFKDQMKAKQEGDDEAMYYDADYITALEYALPPTAGVGIGVDRLVMLLTDSLSIRDVILFPHMRHQE